MVREDSPASKFSLGPATILLEHFLLYHGNLFSTLSSYLELQERTAVLIRFIPIFKASASSKSHTINIQSL